MEKYIYLVIIRTWDGDIQWTTEITPFESKGEADYFLDNLDFEEYNSEDEFEIVKIEMGETFKLTN